MEERRTRYAAIGVMLSCIGISAAAVLKVLLDRNIRELSVAVVLVSVILMLISQNICYYAYPTRGVLLTFLYSFVTVFMSIFADTSIYKSFSFIYQAAYFAQIILVWNLQDKLATSHLVSYIVHVGGVATIVCLFTLIRITAGQESLFFNTIASTSGDDIITREATATLGYITFSSAIAYKTSKKKDVCFKWMALVASLIVIAFSGRRSVYLAMTGAIIVYIRNTRKALKEEAKDILKTYFKWIVIALAVLTAIHFIPEIGVVIDRIGYLIMNGIKTFLGINTSSTADMSAQMRTSVASSVIDQFFHDSNFWQVVFGRGYMTTWVDIPVLQAFWDLGIIGGIWYIVIRFSFPISMLLKTSTNSSTCFSQYFTILSCVEGLANGCPYGVFFSVVLLAACLKSESMMELRDEDTIY